MGQLGDTDVAALVTAGDYDAVTRACLTLGAEALDGQRNVIMATCVPIITQGWWGKERSSADQVESACLAMCAVATSAEYAKSRFVPIPSDLDAARRVLARRDLSFRTTWVALVVDSVNSDGLRIARRMVHEGSMAKPTSDAYTIALVAQPDAFDLTVPLDAPYLPHRAAVLEVLRANPDLLVDDVWRIFEAEGGGENSLAAYDKYTSVDRSWQTALVTLAADGTVDRQRLLDASLDGLQRGFAPFRAQWFSAFHEALEPTIPERAARASTYLALAASPVGPTVSMALKALTMVQKAVALDPVEVVATIGPALLVPAKGTATKAVALLAKAGDASDSDAAALVMVEALGHSSKEVQAAGLKHLRRWSPSGPSPATADRLTFLADGCHISVRADLDGWHTAAGATSTTASEARPAPAPSSAVRFVDITAIDWLASERSLLVITDRDELYERASTAMEDPGDPDEIEVVLAALARFDVSDVVSDRRAQTLAKRAAKLQTNSERSAKAHVAACIVARFAPESWVVPPWRQDPRADKDVVLDELLERRLDALARTFRRRAKVGLLSTPTHRGGWIDPMALVDRLLEWSSTNPCDETDLAAALLRVAPDTDRIGDALRHAGSSGHVPDSVRAVLEGWVAWCRADGDRTSGWTSPCKTHRDAANRVLYPCLGIDGADDVISPKGTPLVVRLQSNGWGSLSNRYRDDPVGLRWAGSLIPGLPGRWACAGADVIGVTSRLPEVQHGDAGLFEAFFDTDVPFGGDAHLLVALATNDRRPEIQSPALDLAVVTAGDGRLDPIRFGREIGRLASTGVVTPSRWGRTLRLLAEAGPVHRTVVRLALEEAMATVQPRKPQDALALLEVLETVLLEDGLGVTRPDVRAALVALGGTSKTGKTATRILGLG